FWRPALPSIDLGAVEQAAMAMTLAPRYVAVIALRKEVKPVTRFKHFIDIYVLVLSILKKWLPGVGSQMTGGDFPGGPARPGTFGAEPRGHRSQRSAWVIQAIVEGVRLEPALR